MQSCMSFSGHTVHLLNYAVHCLGPSPKWSPVVQLHRLNPSKLRFMGNAGARQCECSGMERVHGERHWQRVDKAGSEAAVWHADPRLRALSIPGAFCTCFPICPFLATPHQSPPRCGCMILQTACDTAVEPQIVCNGPCFLLHRVGRHLFNLMEQSTVLRQPALI